MRKTFPLKNPENKNIQKPPSSNNISNNTSNESDINNIKI